MRSGARSPTSRSSFTASEPSPCRSARIIADLLRRLVALPVRGAAVRGAQPGRRGRSRCAGQRTRRRAGSGKLLITTVLRRDRLLLGDDAALAARSARRAALLDWLRLPQRSRGMLTGRLELALRCRWDASQWCSWRLSARRVLPGHRSACLAVRRCRACPRSTWSSPDRPSALAIGVKISGASITLNSCSSGVSFEVDRSARPAARVA